MQYLAIQHTGIGIVTTDLNGIITGFNPAAEQLYGLASYETIGQHATILSSNAVNAELSRISQSVVVEQQSQALNTEQCGRGGKVLQVHLIMSPIIDENSVVTGVSRIVIDIAEQTSAQRALQHERDLFEALLETVTDAFLMIDVEGHVVSANLPFETIFRIPRFQIIGRSSDVLLGMIQARYDLPSAFAALLATFSSNSYQNSGGEFELTIPERHVILWYSAPVNALNGMAMGRLFVFRDVTNEREIDRMKTEFVQLVSHELRTPLQSIGGFADLLLEGEAGPISDRVRDYLMIIRQSAQRLTSMSRDILDLTRIEAGQIDIYRDYYDVRELIESGLAPIHPVLGRRHQQLQVSVDQDLPPIYVDRERFEQILYNLVSNASKFSDDSGRGQIRLHVNTLGADDTLPPGVTQSVLLPAFLFTIHDNGMGIPPEEQEHIFTQFYRTDQATRRQIQGSGLGLTLAKSFVELHGGRIWFNSEVGRGTSIYFTIPLMDGGKLN